MDETTKFPHGYLFLMCHFSLLKEHGATKNYSADASFQNFVSIVTGNKLNSD